MYHVRDEIRKLNQKYTDRLKKHLNILTSNLMKNAKITHRLKRNFFNNYVSDCNSIGHISLPIYSLKSFHTSNTNNTKCQCNSVM